MTTSAERAATLVRMVLPEHTCPFGVEALELLRSHGFQVDDRHLTTRGQVEAFKAENGVATTPQVFIDQKRIGGCEELRRMLEHP